MLGTYLDPNYFSVIMTLPALLAFALYAERRKVMYGILFLSFCSMIVLSGSRSGAATFALTLLAWFGGMFARLLGGKVVSTNNLRLLGLVAGLGVFLGLALAGSIEQLTKRIAETGSADESSMNRLRSLQIGGEMLLAEPLLGYGYNFAVWELVEKKANTGLDSSVQMILVNFGLLPSALIVAAFIFWIATSSQSLRLRFGDSSGLWRIWNLFAIYVTIVILFASLFNNILFYPFWEVPAVMLGTYFSRLGQEHPRTARA
jgi:O-antigen ligase